MLANLTGQLVSLMLSRSMDIDLSHLKQKKEQQSLGALCTVFYELVKQLPPGTVLVCALDEIALYETGAARQDVEDVVRRLVRLVEGCEEIVFKLLVTCRGRALGIGKYFGGGRTLELDEEVEEDDSSRWQIASLG